jgi:16S rRNA (cytosine1402-N4)-methyltransferase
MHKPVMLEEVLSYLDPLEGKTYVDGTFGGGGYTKALLDSSVCYVIACDRDPDAIERAKSLKQLYQNRLEIIHSSFSGYKDHLRSPVDGLVVDLGVSSYQLDQEERGFSFRFDAPLDMRMSKEGLSAYDVIQTYAEKDLADIIYHYGEERASRRIAKAIVLERKKNPITTTKQLANLIKSVIPFTKEGIHPATLTFQALRIFVNNELIEIEEVLNLAKNILSPKGRLVTVSFHSLEDRIVKNFLNSNKDSFDVLTKKPIVATMGELKDNPRARSAKLRAAVKKGEDYA